ncbi:hypothetical protein HY346_01105 [Candidatus Microgenomates bacterium]|nr:hypothetical protein [Candidatus Microgenomates bacterium]
MVAVGTSGVLTNTNTEIPGDETAALEPPFVMQTPDPNTAATEPPLIYPTEVNIATLPPGEPYAASDLPKLAEATEDDESIYPPGIAYELYLSLGSLGNIGDLTLEQRQTITDDLENGLPHHLYARGWALVEMSELLPPTDRLGRLELVEEAGRSWDSSYAATGESQTIYDIKDRYQAALASSYLPLLEDRILGETPNHREYLHQALMQLLPPLYADHQWYSDIVRGNFNVWANHGPLSEEDKTMYQLLAGDAESALRGLIQEFTVIGLLSRARLIYGLPLTPFVSLPREDFPIWGSHSSRNGRKFRWDVTVSDHERRKPERIQVKNKGLGPIKNGRTVLTGPTKGLEKYDPEITVVRSWHIGNIHSLEPSLAFPTLRALLAEIEGDSAAAEALEHATRNLLIAMDRPDLVAKVNAVAKRRTKAARRLIASTLV